MHIVLVEPEIPGNTGNIARLCAAEHLTLHLVEPLGFQIDDKHLKRAGLDYWDLLDVHVHPNYDSVVRMLAGHHFYLNTTKAIRSYTDISYDGDDVLVFGGAASVDTGHDVDGIQLGELAHLVAGQAGLGFLLEQQFVEGLWMISVVPVIPYFSMP